MKFNNTALFVIVYAFVLFVYIYFIEGIVIPEQSDVVNAIIGGLLAGGVSLGLKYLSRKKLDN